MHRDSHHRRDYVERRDQAKNASISACAEKTFARLCGSSPGARRACDSADQGATFLERADAMWTQHVAVQSPNPRTAFRRCDGRRAFLYSYCENESCGLRNRAALWVVSPLPRDCRETVMGRENIGGIVLGVLLGAAIVFVAVGFAVDWAAQSIKMASVNPPLFFIPK